MITEHTYSFQNFFFVCICRADYSPVLTIMQKLIWRQWLHLPNQGQRPSSKATFQLLAG